MGLKKWFNRRNKFEKCLVCCILGLVIIIVVLFICFLTSHDNRVCLKPECIRASIHILDSINASADPCEDFYAFACGQMNIGDKPKNHASTLSSLRALSDYRLKNIVRETEIDGNVVPKSLAFQRTFYKACTDTEKIDQDENRTFLKILDELMGGWPLLKMGHWMENNFYWKTTMLKARKLGVYHNLFFRVAVFENATSEKSILWIRAIDVAHLASTHFTEDNLDKILKIVKDLGADSVDVTHDLRATMTFAEKLTEIVLKHANKTSTYSEERKNITIKDIKKQFIHIDWVTFLKDLTGIPIKETDEVLYDIDGYFNDLYYLLMQTPKRIQANYVGWIILSTNINFLSTNLRNKYEQILKFSNVTLPVENRSDRCFQLSLELFKWTAEAEYVRRFTTKEKKKQVLIMIDYIKSEMEKLIETTQWIDEKSKENALKRLNNITTPIGWLSNAFDVAKMEKLIGFDKVKRQPDFNQTAIDIARMSIKIQYDVTYRTVLKKINEIDSFGVPGNEVNAYFVRNYNILIIPTAIMQGQMFNENQPYYMNFGALGSVIGHELSHGFTLYHNFDMSEEDYGTDLWTNGTAKDRRQIAQCVDDEYNRFQVNQGGTKTNHTSGEENIADINGSNLAYAAYQNWVSYNGREPSLPGIQYNPNQVFWLMSSTYMCVEPYKKKLNQKHGIAEFRVVGRLRQSSAFAKDFNCPLGSKMNPTNKCKIFG